MLQPFLVDAAKGPEAADACAREERLPFYSGVRFVPAVVGSRARSEMIGLGYANGLSEAETSKPCAMLMECLARWMLDSWRCFEDQAVTRWPTLMMSSDCARGRSVSCLLLASELIA